MVLKIGINGFGRIGRLVMRAAKNDPNVKVRRSGGLGPHWHSGRLVCTRDDYAPDI